MTRRFAPALLLIPTLAACGGPASESAGTLPEDSGFIAMDDGVRLFYRTVGDGPQAVVIPVGFYLEEALRPLASEGRTLVFYDPRGRGRSEAGDRSAITLDRQLADLDAVRAGLGVDSMAVLGWSGLGMETFVYTVRNPDRVTRLVQVAPVAARDEPHNAAAYRLRAEQLDTAALASLDAARERGEYDDDPAAYCRALGAITGLANFADPADVEAAPDVCRWPNEHPDSLAMIWPSLLGSFQGYDWREEAAGLRVPRLVIHGAADAFPVQGSREWVPVGSNARLMVLEEAGHFPFLERPDAFFPAVDRFLGREWPD